jgi:hypothetical protein
MCTPESCSSVTSACHRIMSSRPSSASCPKLFEPTGTARCHSHIRHWHHQRQANAHAHTRGGARAPQPSTAGRQRRATHRRHCRPRPASRCQSCRRRRRRHRRHRRRRRRLAPRSRRVCCAGGRGRSSSVVIEAPWLVNGGHGASLRPRTCRRIRAPAKALGSCRLCGPTRGKCPGLCPVESRQRHCGNPPRHAAGCARRSARAMHRAVSS